MKNFAKKAAAALLTLALSLTSIVSLAACGKLERTSFTLVDGTVKKQYLLNDEVDFSRIEVLIKYSDESYDKTLTKNDLTLRYDADITATKGEKTVVFAYVDPVLNNEEVTGEFKVKVVENTIDLDNVLITSFTAPASITQRQATINAAGSISYGEEKFSGNFYSGEDSVYYVGDDNAFEFIPEMKALVPDETGIPATENITVFKSEATVKMFNDVTNGYDELTSRKVENTNDVEYYLGDTKILTFDSLYNKYLFVDGVAVGKTFEISVKPSSNYAFDDDDAITPVTLTIKVIDAFNVYNAKQLSAIDNYSSRHTCNDDEPANIWNEIKQSAGVDVNKNYNGIVLHKDINVTVNDIPSFFFVTTTNDVEYTVDNSNEKYILKKGSKTLLDGTDVYMHVGQGGTFTIQGNYFNISTAEVPLVASNAVYAEGDGKHYTYGGDFSNSVLFRFKGSDNNGSVTGEDLNATINNLSIIGNAARSEYKDTQGGPLHAGGLIFLKTGLGTTTVNNVIGNSYFITYFPNGEDDQITRNCDMILNQVKCFDSYQNAAFVWGDGYLEVNNSTLENAGGPLVLMQHPTDGGKGFESRKDYFPTLKTNNSNLKAELSGQEFWFTAVGATSAVSQVRLVEAFFKAIGGKTMFNDGTDKGKMNIVALTMPDGSSAESAALDGTAQGRVEIKTKNGNFVHSRVMNDANWMNNVEKLKNYTILGFDNNETTVNKIFIANDNTAYDINNNLYQPNPQGEMSGTNLAQLQLYQRITTSQYFVINKGGLGVVLGLY